MNEDQSSCHFSRASHLPQEQNCDIFQRRGQSTGDIQCKIQIAAALGSEVNTWGKDQLLPNIWTLLVRERESLVKLLTLAWRCFAWCQPETCLALSQAVSVPTWNEENKNRNFLSAACASLAALAASTIPYLCLGLLFPALQQAELPAEIPTAGTAGKQIRELEPPMVSREQNRGKTRETGESWAGIGAPKEEGGFAMGILLQPGLRKTLSQGVWSATAFGAHPSSFGGPWAFVSSSQ